MTAPSVRPAEPADDERVTELRRRARDEVSGGRGGPELLETTPARPVDGDLLVAEVDGVVLGYARVTRRDATAVLDELFTEPRARGVGIGHALVEATIERSRAAGCTALESVALPGDRDTKNFFESHGMRARLLVVHRDLGQR